MPSVREGGMNVKGVAGFDAGKAVQTVNLKHDQIIDALLMDPRKTQSQLAEEFGYSRSWLNRVMSSDAFQAKLAARRK